jgi:hypothetical protein
MTRPAFTAKLRINYTKTWAQLTRLFKNPAPIRPKQAPAHLAEALAPQVKFKLPRLKGNVWHTMKEIINIFMAEWRTSARPINVAIRTTRTSLAKRCGNLDPKTAYRHILALIEHGFLRAKLHVRGGLQLLLNPDLIVFDAAPAVVQATMQPSPAPVADMTPAQGLASFLALAKNFSQNVRRAT